MVMYSVTRGKGPDLVLLHGWGLDSRVWSGVADELARDFRLTFIDLPGHGHSPARAATDLPRMARALVRAAPGNAIWLGWSLGGLAALQAALDEPSRVARVLTVASTPRFVRADDWPRAVAPAVFDDFAGDLQRDYPGTVRRFLALQARGSEQGRDTLRALRGLAPEAGTAAPPALARGLDILRQTDLRSRFAGLEAPLAMLFGARDGLVPAGVAEHIADLRPGADVTILEGAGHAPFISHPAEFCRWVRGACGVDG